MAEDLVFMMGKFEARIPSDRYYSENHLWLEPCEKHFRVGFTSYSVRLLQDVYFLDWNINPQTDVPQKKEIGEVDKAESIILEKLKNKEKIMGFGHRLYRTGDSRTQIIKDGGRKLAEQEGNTLWHDISDIMEKVMLREKNIYPNLDFPAATA